MATGAGIIGYVIQEVSAQYHGKLKYKGSVAFTFGTNVTAHLISGMPVIAILKEATETIWALCEYITTTKDTLAKKIKWRNEWVERIKKDLGYADIYGSYVNPAHKQYLKEMDDEIIALEKSIDQPQKLMRGLGVGIAVTTGGYFLWMSNNPDVSKQIITSTEKVLIRAIDETSEIIDKSGELLKDTINGILPDIWGLGWK